MKYNKLLIGLSEHPLYLLNIKTDFLKISFNVKMSLCFKTKTLDNTCFIETFRTHDKTEIHISVLSDIMLENYNLGIKKFVFKGMKFHFDFLDLSKFIGVHIKSELEDFPFSKIVYENNETIIIEHNDKSVDKNCELIKRFWHINAEFRIPKINYDFAEILQSKNINFQAMINVPRYEILDGKFKKLGRRQAKRIFFDFKGFQKYTDGKWILEDKILRKITPIDRAKYF